MTTNQHVKVVDGVELLSLDTFAMLCGVTAEEANAEYGRQQAIRPGRFIIPKSWIRSSKELQAKHGTRDYSELLARIEAERGVA